MIKKVVAYLISVSAMLSVFQSCSYPDSDYLCEIRVGISKSGTSLSSAIFRGSITGIDLGRVSELGFWVATIQKYDEGQNVECSPTDFSISMPASSGDTRIRAYAVVDGITIYSEELYY